MGALFLQITTLALGVAMSPLPVVAVLVILITKRARPGSIVAAVSWVLGNALIISLAVVFAGSIPEPRGGTDLWWEGIFTVLLGVGLAVMGVMSRRGRRNSPEPDAPPTWVNSVDHLSPVGAGLVTFTNATTSPKNLALAITAGKVINRAGLSASAMTSASVFYVVVASLSVVVPVLMYFVGGEKSVALLKRWRDSVTANAAAVMEITLLVLGIGLSVKGLYNLLS